MGEADNAWRVVSVWLLVIVIIVAINAWFKVLLGHKNSWFSNYQVCEYCNVLMMMV